MIKETFFNLIGFNPKHSKRKYLVLLLLNLGIYFLDWVLYVSLKGLAGAKPRLMEIMPYLFTASWIIGSVSSVLPSVYKTKSVVRFNRYIQRACLVLPPIMIMFGAVVR